MTAETLIEDDRWTQIDLPRLTDQATAATLTHLGLDPEACELTVLACDDSRIAVLNAEFRDKPTPTNVLSWPSEDLAPEIEGDTPMSPSPDITGEIALGDIAIAYDTCAREAAEAGKTLRDHATHLIIHGLLHLLGYDHIRDGDATLMEETEVRILGTLGIDDPYRVD
ncbi:rRNA maturation RNase YbeY [Aestuariivita boseongensis]|uniref:rRNA maturation RNase YbeY n=1 Tax=Aestuariivita boseongensis TaxID=1470562 RepID=UPI00068223AC|nr:rRNA maturation RNase YbeY [Aestuariivita boseongensis]